jgi:hypothetical protein
MESPALKINLKIIAFREDGAKDWYSKLEISVKHRGNEDKLQFHHIYPKAFLKLNYPDLRRNQRMVGR